MENINVNYYKIDLIESIIYRHLFYNFPLSKYFRRVKRLSDNVFDLVDL